MKPFTFVQLADVQFGLFSHCSGKSDEEISRLAEMGIFLRPAPFMTGLAPEESLFSTAVNAINRIDPAFAILCGDIADTPAEHGQFETALQIASQVDDETPFHWVPGNHDLAYDFTEPQPELLQGYRSRFGKDYYTFRVEEAAFFVVNSTVLSAPDALPGEASAQIDFLRDELTTANSDGAAVRALFTHHPPYIDHPEEPDSMWNISNPYRRHLLDLLSEHRVSTVFAGHLHRNHETNLDGLHVITSGSVGYPLGDDPSGYRVVRVTEKGFSHEFVPIDEPPDNTVARQLLAP